MLDVYPFDSVLFPINWVSMLNGSFGRAATDEIAPLLSIEEGYPLLVAERLTCSDAGKPVEHISFYYRSDCYKFTVTLQRAGTMSLVVPPFPGQASAPAAEGGEQGDIAASLQLAKEPGRSDR